jgi:hypothetical protein
MDAVSAVAPHKLDVVRVILGAAVAPVFHKRIILGFAPTSPDIASVALPKAFRLG